MKTNTCLAMLLAGGEGRRLAPLTATMAKPAVPFGGHCRIIDYTLSNCVHSGINTIGVLTQYQAESLHNHIGDGSSWQTAGIDKEVDISLLPASRFGGEGYLGTADAIYQNIDYIDRQNSEHVLILSGDHIYQMDYNEMLQNHIASGAVATIAVKRVPWKEASRFGIMNTSEGNRIVEFDEKPQRPKSNLASMGIYMFRWAELRAALIEDHGNKNSSHDFGADLIPLMLGSEKNLYAYPFDGYWRDVGTVESLWEAHMDLINGEMAAASDEQNLPGAWPILTREHNQTVRSYVCPTAEIQSSYIHRGSSVEGDLDRSVIFGNVSIGKGADIRESIVMPGAHIGSNVTLYRTIVGEGAIIEDGAVIGNLNDEVTVIGTRERVMVHPRFSVSSGQMPHSLLAELEQSMAVSILEKVRS
ncbi:glucose-1-phosphate adenylyltransferase [Paenibacillus baekrokdamisoli]|uniref:Glucose-1-phosphate adenylyltransferase n=1 Tax=Paenibacillus baekrokdamisoli TaxID=1712516 RepID=A0A3G9IZM4_9BACL|nr:glucose-1-phosphate adenylyltransferase [Paenibacillus baekrokdamisoli]MBB3068907.1 glucose-1-phosphate adenylyltransferase [Paenibacillus baekrokdamisoli]BBH23732.1 glucose-1-phosphate adenylyltransferase [Paenibacillus baekrokdamisoli]